MTLTQLEAREAELRAVVERLLGQYNDLDRRAEAEGRANDDGVLEKLERLRLGYNAALERYNEAKAATYDATHAMLADRALNPANREAGFDGSYGGSYGGSQPLAAHDASVPAHVRAGRELGLRAVERMRGDLSAAAGDRLTDLVERDKTGADSRYLDAASNPAYARAFWRRLSRPHTAQYEMTPEEGEAMRAAIAADEERALSIGSGLLPLPTTIDPSVLLTSDGSINPLRELATVTTISSFEWRGVTSAGVTAAFSAEGVEVADGTPTLVAPVIHPEKAQVFIPFSIESGMDWASLEQEMAQLISDAKDQLEAVKFLTGAGHGSNEPEGITAGIAAGSVITAAGTASYAVADTYKVQNALPARFSPRARWLSSLTVANLSWQFVKPGDVTNAKIWNDERTSLLGKPWSEYSTMPIVTTTGQLFAIYGDVKACFKIVDRVGMSIEVIPHLFGGSGRPTGQRGFYGYFRTSSATVVDNAIRVLKAG
jgi:HK97 family phage major capsid protein